MVCSMMYASKECGNSKVERFENLDSNLTYFVCCNTVDGINRDILSSEKSGVEWEERKDRQ